MTAAKRQTNIRTVFPEDKFWFIDPKTKTHPRAGFKISQRCPVNYKFLLDEALMHGWITPVAYMTTEEQFWEVLASPTEGDAA